MPATEAIFTARTCIDLMHQTFKHSKINRSYRFIPIHIIPIEVAILGERHNAQAEFNGFVFRFITYFRDNFRRLFSKDGSLASGWVTL